jgi:hypothetical protein
VNISRGRRGVRIFTLDKEQFRKNVARSGHRTLALELVDDFVPHGDLLWDWLHDTNCLRMECNSRRRFAVVLG